jgi:hypothetical protein
MAKLAAATPWDFTYGHWCQILIPWLGGYSRLWHVYPPSRGRRIWPLVPCRPWVRAIDRNEHCKMFGERARPLNSSIYNTGISLLHVTQRWTTKHKKLASFGRRIEEKNLKFLKFLVQSLHFLYEPLSLLAGQFITSRASIKRLFLVLLSCSRETPIFTKN